MNTYIGMRTPLNGLYVIPVGMVFRHPAFFFFLRPNQPSRNYNNHVTLLLFVLLKKTFGYICYDYIYRHKSFLFDLVSLRKSVHHAAR